MRVYYSLEEIPENIDGTSVAIGLFDGLHLGHQKVIKTAVDYALEHNLTSTVFTFNISKSNWPTNKIGNRKINTENIFLDTLKDLGIEMVVSLPFESVKDLSPYGYIEQILKNKLNAKFASCGKDFHFGHNATGTWREFKMYGDELGIKTQAVPLVLFGDKPISSTTIRELIQAGDIPEANDMLGHKYAIDFEVVCGNRIGRTLGTPTINQPYPDNYLIPKFGVYATLTSVDGKLYTSVTNVGTKPTIGKYDALAETFIQNFSGDLYGQQIKVEFLQFLRKEIKFDNIEELRERIYRDSVEAELLGGLYIK